MRILAIDQGTTSTKALLVEGDGQYRLIGSRRQRQILPGPGRVEHDAAELLKHVDELLEEGVAAGAEAMALANQGETIVAWDRTTGVPIYNAIVWQDQRSTGFVEQVRAAGHESEITERSGLPLDAYFSASKLRWILDEVPEARRLLASGRLGLATSDAYFHERLTGRYVTDVTTAARTSLMNLESCSWDSRLCEIFGVPIDVLPEIVECDAVIGEARGIPLAAAMVDQIAALHGHGCTLPGDAKITFGTGAFALGITTGRVSTPNVISAIAWRSPAGRVFAADGGIYTAGAAIEWLIRLGLLQNVEGLGKLEGSPAASRGVYFVPALSGLGCPHWDRSAAGLWIGLDAATGRDDLVKSVLEGVAFRAAEVLDVLGAAPNRIMSVDGGLTRCDYFLRFLATISQRRLTVPDIAELTAFGAAQLAAKALGEPAIGTGTSAPRQVEPENGNPQWRALFTEARKRSSGWRQDET